MTSYNSHKVIFVVSQTCASNPDHADLAACSFVQELPAGTRHSLPPSPTLTTKLGVIILSSGEIPPRLRRMSARFGINDERSCLCRGI